MAVTKQRTFEQANIDGEGIVRIHFKVEYFDDSVLDLSINKVKVYDVEDDVTALPNIIQNMCAAIWTPAVVNNRLTKINEMLTVNELPTESTLAAAKAAANAAGLINLI